MPSITSPSVGLEASGFAATPGAPAFVMRAMRFRSIDNVRRSERWRAGAIDDHDVANRQRRKRSCSFVGFGGPARHQCRAAGCAA